MAPLLEVQNLHVAYATRTAQVCPALVDVSFRLAPTEFDANVVKCFLTFAQAEIDTVFAAAGTSVSLAL